MFMLLDQMILAIVFMVRLSVHNISFDNNLLTTYARSSDVIIYSVPNAGWPWPCDPVWLKLWALCLATTSGYFCNFPNVFSLRYISAMKQILASFIKAFWVMQIPYICYKPFLCRENHQILTYMPLVKWNSSSVVLSFLHRFSFVLFARILSAVLAM